MGQDKELVTRSIETVSRPRIIEAMAKKNKLADTIAYLNYEYLSVVAKLCGEPVDSLIERMAERAASAKDRSASAKQTAPKQGAPKKKRSSTQGRVKPARAA
jgi:hypothetical protein